MEAIAERKLNINHTFMQSSYVKCKGCVKPDTVRLYTAKLRYFLSNYSKMHEDGTTQVLVDGAYKKLSGIMFNDPEEHEFLLMIPDCKFTVYVSS